MGNRVQFVALAVNDTPDNVSAFVRQYGWTMPVGVDTGEVANAFNVGSIPTTVFFTASGTVSDVRVGALSDSDYDQAVAKLGN